MLIGCPLCGPRDSTEFRYVDEVVTRPDPGAEQAPWRAYLYLRANPAGATRELWLHRLGCRQYLVLERNTVTNKVSDARLARTR